MNHSFLRKLCLLSLVLSATALLAQQDFSADLVTMKGKDTKLEAKIFATKDKMRIEPQERQAGQGGVVILDLASQTTEVLMPAQKMYMEFAWNQGPGMRRWGTFFRPADIEDACTEWQKLDIDKGGSCKKIGSETVNGRKTVKYQGTSAEGKTGYIWLDSSIVFPIKWQGSDDDSGELRNISEGSQAASLFTVPSDYRKFQMPAGMQGMRQHQ